MDPCVNSTLYNGILQKLLQDNDIEANSVPTAHALLKKPLFYYTVTRVWAVIVPVQDASAQLAPIC